MKRKRKKKSKKCNNLQENARYCQVFELLLAGKSRKQIAGTLKIDTSTLWRWMVSDEFKAFQQALFSEMKSLFISAQSKAFKKAIVMLDGKDPSDIRFAVGILLKAGSITIVEGQE